MLVKDVRAVLRLLNEVQGLSHRAALWKEHLLSRLCRLVRAEVGVLAAVRNVLRERRWQVVWHMDLDCVRPNRRGGNRCSFEEAGRLDPMQTLARRRGQIVTAARRDVLDDEAWYGSPQVQQVRRVRGIDDCIYSLYRLPRRGWAKAIFLHRGWGDPEPFTPRERQMVHLLHTGLDSLYQRESDAGEQTEEDPPLTSRMRQTLHLLLSGAGEKQVATALSLSRHTVHVYVRSLYRCFHVNSRAELLALFVPQGEYGVAGANRPASRCPRRT